MRRTAVAALLAASSWCGLARADEGMWLLTKPPVAAIKAAYGVDVTPAWLEHQQKSAVRFDTGGSGSLVSADGLVMTNHHVGSDMISKLSTAQKDLLKDGYTARTHEQELKCPDLVVDILWEIEDVTSKVTAAAEGKDDPAEAGAARRRRIGELEQESKSKTGLKSQVVTLYQGGQYHLYRYRTYNDLRLVFAPEEQAAYFGGDTDNFEFPRYNLDCCFFRIYENDKPLKAEHHLSWSKSGTAAGDPIFVVGHPGRTRRLYTVDHLRFLRDVQLPTTMQNLWRSEVKNQTFANRSAENARIIRDDIAGVNNTRKAFTGLLAGLQDPKLMAIKVKEEEALRAKVAADPLATDKYGDAWEDIGAAQEAYAEFFLEKFTLDGVVRGSPLIAKALHFVRLADELALPSDERLPEYREAGLEEFYFGLYSPEPIYDALEEHRLSMQLSRLCELFSADAEFVQEILAGKSPRDRARELVAGCSFKDPAARRELVKGGRKAIEASKDELLKVAAAIDGASRELRKKFEDDVESVERSCYAGIAAAKFMAQGDSVYPDATFSLRLSYGSVKPVGSDPAYTDMAGMFARAAERKGDPLFELPARWVEAKDKLNLKAPFNFVCTADIIGGNSGSPVVNAAGEVVGLIFDGNIDSLVGDVIYDAANARAVAVDSRGMIEVIKNVYGATELAKELGN
jgi:hypothetical protein